jgi:hypothetical protein
MKTIVLAVIIFSLAYCGKGPESSIELIKEPARQDAAFRNLLAVTQDSIPESLRSDSLSFLILPVQASCPACRKKTIDSIMKYQATLSANHYIIVSANGGRKTIRGYFQEQGYELPRIRNQLFLDSTNLAYRTELYKDKPTIYYSYQRKAYKKVAAMPATVRNDLRDFFSGCRKPVK